MKKHIYILSTVILLFYVSGCNNGGKQRNPSSADSEDKKTEWTDRLDRYEALVDKNNALQEKVKAGDMNAMQDIANVSKEMIDVSTNIQQHKGSMSASESKRLIDIIQKIKY